VAWVIFDGRGTSKNEWFDASKILYSSYLDITSLSSAVSSISGYVNVEHCAVYRLKKMLYI